MPSICKLTVYFEDPFWVALAEIEDGYCYRAARHVFGPEPTEPEVELFVKKGWQQLRFSPETRVREQKDKHVNPKRMRRIAEREMRLAPGKGTKAQQALAEQREANKIERKKNSHEAREARKDEAFRMRQEKRKRKHRGH